MTQTTADRTQRDAAFSCELVTATAASHCALLLHHLITHSLADSLHERTSASTRQQILRQRHLQVNKVVRFGADVNDYFNDRSLFIV